jgi:hypothetical protein
MTVNNLIFVAGNWSWWAIFIPPVILIGLLGLLYFAAKRGGFLNFPLKFLLACILLVIFYTVGWAASAKLSAITNLGAAPASTDELYLNDAGTEKALTIANLMLYLGAAHDTEAELTSLFAAREIADAAIVKSDEAETLTANWVNTDNPWADNEVADSLTLSLLKMTALTAEPSEVVGEIYRADGDTWDPAGLGITDDYFVICTAAGTPGTFKALFDITGKWWVSSVEIPNGTDPDVDAAGEISNDTDGANETGDVSLRAYDGTNQFAFARKLHCIHATAIKPNDWADTERDQFVIWSNESGMTFTITKIEAWSDTDDTSINLEEFTGIDWSSSTTIDAVEIATNGTGVFYQTETSISNPAIEANNVIAIDFDDTDDPGLVKVSICGWFNADVD